MDVNPTIMVQMHHGSVVYLLKATSQYLFDLSDQVVQKAITACWNSVSTQH